MLHGYMFVIQPRGLDTCACGDIGRSRYTTHVVLNLILLISRDAIHLVVVGTLIGSLPCYRLMIDPAGNRGGTADNGSATAMLQSWRNKPTPPRVPRLAITLSSSESAARSYNSLIRGLLKPPDGAGSSSSRSRRHGNRHS